MDARTRSELGEQLRRLGDGERGAFDAAFATLLGPVRALCRRMLGDDAFEDAAQRAMLKIFERVATYDGARDGLTWALAITAWECRSVRRERGRARWLDADAVDEPATAPEDSPEAEAARRELSAMAAAIMVELSPADRETLMLALTDEAPAGLAAATMRKRRERAWTRFRAMWRSLHGG
jgi:RNA polymerase sigma factor (sigma-70 family)